MRILRYTEHEPALRLEGHEEVRLKDGVADLICELEEENTTFRLSLDLSGNGESDVHFEHGIGPEDMPYVALPLRGMLGISEGEGNPQYILEAAVATALAKCSTLAVVDVEYENVAGDPSTNRPVEVTLNLNIDGRGFSSVTITRELLECYFDLTEWSSA